MTRIIQLTRGKQAIVDDEDYAWLRKWNWCYGSGYANRSFYSASGKYTLLAMHREIMKAPDDMEVDHIDGNRLDNRRSNLRICTSVENHRNCAIRKDNTSGYKGVSWRQSKWKAQICLDSKLIFLGYFDDVLDAARAYDEAARKYFGLFARTNNSLRR